VSAWRWPDFIAALVARARSDVDLVAFLGGEHIYKTVDLHAKRARGLGYQRITDPRREITEEPLVQWDMTAEPGEITVLERHARRVLTSDVPVRLIVGGADLVVHMEFDDAREHARPSDGLAHHSIDVRYRVPRLRSP
jgi:hypothetical protein